MLHTLDHLSTTLKSARKAKKLSQRGLSDATGLTQAQISKIENATADFKTSTLIELARTLDLEVMLVPRQLVPAVNALTDLGDQTADSVKQPRAAYALGDEDDDG